MDGYKMKLCPHLEKTISFKEYCSKKINNETISFYCNECNKLFVEKGNSNIAGDNMIIMFIAYSIINLFERLLQVSVTVEIIIALICLGIIFILELFLKWKFISFAEFSFINNEWIACKPNRLISD